MNLLTLLLILPLAGFLIALLLPRSSPQSSRAWALAISLIVFVVSLALPANFDRNAAGE
jgi:NADH:ubiquinone oxidoreductase subunit 4 (subunit M)